MTLYIYQYTHSQCPCHCNDSILRIDRTGAGRQRYTFIYFQNCCLCSII